MPAPKRVPVMSERLMKLQSKVAPTVAEPYEVTDTITVLPLTTKRSEAMAEAYGCLSGQQTLLNAVLKRAAAPRPAYPDAPVAPTPPDNDKDAEQAAAYAQSLDVYEKAVNVWRDEHIPEWEGLHEKWDAEIDLLSETIESISTRTKKFSDDYTRALFGGVYDQVREYFSEQPIELWNAFVEDIKEHFGLSPKASQAPEDGRCKECGHIEDEEQAGKAPESSN